MSDFESQFEQKDNSGSTVAFSGTATTTFANVPTVADKIISQLLIEADGNNLEVSFDGGTTYFALSRNGVLTWDVKGEIKQIQVRTSSGSTDYKALLNFEVY